MITFEKLAYFVTGIRCEPSRSGIAIRVVLGLLVTSACLALSLIFAGAGAGNANSVGSFMSLLLPVAAMYAVYLFATLVLLGKSWRQAAQFMAWSPVLLVAAVLALGFVLSLSRN